MENPKRICKITNNNNKKIVFVSSLEELLKEGSRSLKINAKKCVLAVSGFEVESDEVLCNLPLDIVFELLEDNNSGIGTSNLVLSNDSSLRDNVSSSPSSFNQDCKSRDMLYDSSGISTSNLVLSNDSSLRDNIASSHPSFNQDCESRDILYDSSGISTSNLVLSNDSSLRDNVASSHPSFNQDCESIDMFDDSSVFFDKGSLTLVMNEDHIEEIELNEELTIVNKANGIGNKFKIRPYKVCPYCDRKVKDISEHLKLHGLPEDERKILLNSLRLRRPYRGTKIGRPCPFERCRGQKPYPRLDHHLQRVHNLNAEDKLYQKFVKPHNSFAGAGKITLKSNDSTEYSDFSEKAKDAFYNFLMSLSGGDVGDKCAKQQSYKVRQIINGLNISSYNSILNDEVISRLESWFLKYSERNLNSSCKTYCSVFITFLQFLSSQEPSKVSEFQLLQQKIAKWRKAFSKRAKGEYNEARELEVPAEDIHFFLNSDLHATLVKTLINYSVEPDNTLKFKYQIRNLLLIRAMFRNAPRSAALANMRIIEFERAIRIDDEKNGEGYVVSVADHKTIDTHGAAPIVLPIALHKLFVLYRLHVRSTFDMPINDNVEGFFFCTSSGKYTTSDDVHKGISSIWRDAGLKSKIGTTIFRKTSTTEVHRVHGQEVKEGVARLMCHKLSTAENSYKLRTKAARSFDSSNKLYNTVIGIAEPNFDDIRESHSSVTSASPHMAETEDEDLLEVEQAFSSIDFIQKYSLAKKSTLIEPSVEESDADPTYTYTPQEGNHRGRCFFSDSERLEIKAAFIVNIQHAVVPVAKVIKAKIENSDALRKLQEAKKCDTKSFILKVRGAIQNFVNKEKKNKLT